ncbi:MAG TPA: ATP-binding protein, partial [Bacteroidetes bacterium]|nr:ATP-binding protein [Bacteroidota bacterium]
FGLNDRFFADGTLPHKRFDTLFITPQEMLSWYKGFSSLYVKREISFDKVYYDLSVALGLQPLRNSALEDAKILAAELEKEMNVEVLKKDEKFYIRFIKEGNEHEAAIVAQGINKIAQLIYLINNGSLDENTILFWDEPEVSLNPKYISIVAKFLQTLANAGLQIFVASHDYLLVQELSLLAEYKKEIKNAPDIKFFALYKGEDGSTQVEEGRSMADIQNDAIIQEFIAHDAREKALWK